MFTRLPSWAIGTGLGDRIHRIDLVLLLSVRYLTGVATDDELT